MEITYIGGPTAVLRMGGVSFLTDPGFDTPRDYPLGNRKLTRLTPPALRPDELGPIDAVLLSHDQHVDNLDHAGRALLASIPTVLSTPEAANRLDGVTGLGTWDTATVGPLTVTGVPARHGPVGAEVEMGTVTGFVLGGDGVPTVYVSGDNAATECVAEVVARLGPIDIAVLFAGAARGPFFGGAALTLTATDAVEAARILDPAVIVPVHAEGWAHFSEGPDVLAKAFADAGRSDRLRIPPAGTALRL